MDHNIKKTKLKAPEGFRNLLEALTCEILRVQPQNIPKFAAEYLKGRLIARQENGYDECLLGSQIDGFYNYEPLKEDRSLSQPSNDVVPSNGASPSNNVSSSTEKSEKPSKAHLDKGDDVLGNGSKDTLSNSKTERRVIHYEDENQAASKIQAGFHGYKCRQQINKQHQAAEKIQAGYRGYACRKDIKQQHEAATKIQTKYKQFQSQRGTAKVEREKAVNEDEIKETLEKKREKENESETKKQIQSNNSKEDAAATKIQANYRGYRARMLKRKQLKAAIKIQSNYRGYRVRERKRSRNAAVVKIQKTYRGYKVRKTQREKSQAATTIQSHYRGYRTREDIKKKPQLPQPANDLLGVVPYDNRASFSIPTEDVQFDGDLLDSDSDIDIDKVVDEMEAKKKMKESEG